MFDPNFLNPTRFYVDELTGNDLNRGDSPYRAWKTQAKINSYAQFKPGDKINIIGRLTAGAQTRILPARAEGDRPVTVRGYAGLAQLDCWKILKPIGWVETDTGVWRIAVNVDIEGNTITVGSHGANIARLVDETDAIVGAKRLAMISPASPDLDFYSDMIEYLYLRSDTDPGVRFSELRASPDIRGVIGVDSFTKWECLRVSGAGGNAAGLNRCRDVTIDRCWLDHVGGSINSLGQAYGNGVDVFGSGYNHTITRNLVTQCIDAAYTPQGYPNNVDGEGFHFNQFDENWAAQCRQAWEVWAFKNDTISPSPVTPVDGTGFVYDPFLNAHLWDIGLGYTVEGASGEIVPCVLLQNVGMEVPYNPIKVTFAEMHNCGTGAFMRRPGGSQAPFGVVRPLPDFDITGPVSLIAGTQLLRGGTPQNWPQTVEQFKSFVEGTGMMTGATVSIEPADQPLTPISVVVAKWRAAVGL